MTASKKISAEQSALLSFLKPALRSKKQVNRPHESDCEILKLSSHLFLATSIDSFSDEWAIQLFRKPETLARICVHGTISDLVVSGASPLGFLFSAQWGAKDPKIFKSRIFSTVIAELNKINVPLLGGDEGTANELSLTGVAIGTSKQKPKTRLGIKPGQWLCTLGEFGIGPALGFQYLLGQKPDALNEDLFRPTAQTNASSAILLYATASMDSSDGLCSTLHFLSELNDLRFELDEASVRIHPAAKNFCKKNNLPSLTLWFGEIGDYQPIFTLDEADYSTLQKKLPSLRRIGKVRPKKEKDHTLLLEGKSRPFNPGLFSKDPKSTLPEIKASFDRMVHWLFENDYTKNR